MSMNDAECQTKARKLGGILGAIAFLALWLLGSTGIGWAFVTGVICALILARTACYVMGCLPEPKVLSPEEVSAMRRATPAAPPAAARPTAEKSAPARPVAEPAKPVPAKPAPAAAVKPAAAPEPAPKPEPVAAKPAPKPELAPEPAPKAAAADAKPAAPASPAPAGPAGGGKRRGRKR